MVKKILCVDDEPGVLHVLRSVLARQGYEVRTTTEAEDTFRLFEEETPDLLVLDVQMPGISGLEIFDQLKARFRECPVLFATGYPSAFHLDSDEKVDRYQNGFADGRTDILYKPFRKEDVLEKVASLIGLAESAA